MYRERESLESHREDSTLDTSTNRTLTSNSREACKRANVYLFTSSFTRICN